MGNTKGDQPRRHHFVSQFYLAGFTKNDSAKDALYVLDKKQLKTWKSTPENTAHIRDFHAIDPEKGGDPMVVEKELGKLEGQWRMTLRAIIEAEALPSDDKAIADLMMFVAFQFVRVQRIRSILSDSIDGLSKSLIQMILATAESRAGFRKVVESQDKKLTDQEFEQFVEFGKGGEYDVDYEQTWHVQQMIQMATVLAPLLNSRKWSLWIADADSPDLICSDSPVAATWATAPDQWIIPPAFGTPNTIVSVPLNRRVAIVSMIEKQLPEMRLNKAGVAAVNSMTSMYANQVFSSESDFVWTMKDYSLGNSVAMLTALRDERSQQGL